MAIADFDGLDWVLSGLGSLAVLPYEWVAPLLRNWERIIVEGNRRGVLQGVDGFGRPMTPLKYRNGRGNARKTDRKGMGFGENRQPSRYDNLTTAQYQELTGPRLAPRRLQSRVVKNLYTGQVQTGERQYEAFGAWDSVKSNDGFAFLPVHFEGSRRVPRYDLRPVRPEDRQRARDEALRWAKATAQRAFGK